MSVSAVARREGVSWHKVMGLVSSWAERVAEHRRRQRCRILLVDETSIRRRHRYVTVVLNGETGHILAMLEHRSTAALAGFFREQTPGWRRGVKVVVTDGSRAYKSAIDTWIPNARHVLDRFHVVPAGSQQGSPRCAVTYNRRPDGTLPAFDPDVFRARFALLRRGDQLSGSSSPHRQALGRPSPATGRLGRPPRALRPLPGRGLRRRTRRAGTVRGSLRHRQAEFSKVVDTVIAWGDEILAWHRCGRPSNGRLEGANNLLQVLRRVAHGFTNPNNYAARGLLLI